VLEGGSTCRKQNGWRGRRSPAGNHFGSRVVPARKIWDGKHIFAHFIAEFVFAGDVFCSQNSDSGRTEISETNIFIQFGGHIWRNRQIQVWLRQIRKIAIGDMTASKSRKLSMLTGDEIAQCDP
jgi:hypothetical protein